ncbi:DUF695 domain-containing protein [Limibacter armeniacum]|uniref:DUF695 domain-containing protein n=1 Tax=Limibacter armeniacum TaxID=466084 RepID=UPI002FE5B1C7
MGFFDRILKRKQKVQVSTYAEFWEWFTENEASFFEVVKSRNDIEKNFLDHIFPLLGQLNEGFYLQTGMCNDDTAELVITSDGNFKVMPYVEELVACAPKLPNWRITAHKPIGGHTMSINMADHNFNDKTFSFCINEHAAYPDKIDISLVYQHFNKEEAPLISNGAYIYLDSYLGELNSLTMIDAINVIGPDDTQKELIDIKKLSDYLNWREKEFVEKYDSMRHDTENDQYVALELKTPKGLPIIAVMNQTLLQWDAKASHPWMAVLDIRYDGSSQNGMPDEVTYQAMDEFEDILVEELKDLDGYLCLGRETGDNQRTIFFACKDFRKPVKVIDQLKLRYANMEMEVDVFKDKYWEFLNRYINVFN